MIHNEHTPTDRGIYLDKGPIPVRIKNTRFVNHSHLSAVASDFIPQLVVPESDVLSKAMTEFKYPVEKISGPQWQQLIGFAGETKFWAGKEIMPFSFTDHLQVAVQALREIKFLFEQYGIVLSDRNPANIKLVIVDGDGHFKQAGLTWKVYQVDFETVYDAVTGEARIGENVDLNDRKNVLNSENFYNQRQAITNLAVSAIMPILNTVHHLQSVPYFVETISKESLKEIKKFTKLWNNQGVQGKNTSKVVTPEIALEHLQKLISFEENAKWDQKDKKIESKLARLFRRLFK